MLKMIGTTASSSSYCSSRRGMPFLHSTTTLVALFHSRSSKPKKPQLVRERDPVPSKPKVTSLEDALNLFDEMLQRRPLPSVVRVNQILTQVSKLKHHSAVISLNKQMGLIGISSIVYH
jgi:hypothetical protein